MKQTKMSTQSASSTVPPNASVPHTPAMMATPKVNKPESRQGLELGLGPIEQQLDLVNPDDIRGVLIPRNIKG